MSAAKHKRKLFRNQTGNLLPLLKGALFFSLKTSNITKVDIVLAHVNPEFYRSDRKCKSSAPWYLTSKTVLNRPGLEEEMDGKE